MLKKLKTILKTTVGCGCSSFILFIIIVIITILAGSLMRVFGFEYYSIWSAILYFIIVSIASFPLELLIDAFSKILLEFKIINKKTQITLFVILDTLNTSVVMSIVDYFMDSIYASDLAIFILSLVLALLSIKDYKESDVSN